MHSKGRRVSNSGLSSAHLGANRFGIVSRLADDLAHEIKNPLHSMVINLEVLRRRVEAGSKDAALDRAAVLEHEIQRLHGLIERLLVLLRPSRAAEPFSSVSDVLADVVPLIEIRARLARREFVSTAAGEALAGISAEALRFALLNVLDTAFDGVTDHGDVELRGSLTGHEIRFEVRSSGTRPPEPSDPRLAAAATLVEQVGGRIELEEPAGDLPVSKILLAIPRAAANHLGINRAP